MKTMFDLFAELGVSIEALLAPFERLSDYINEVFMDTSIDVSVRDKILDSQKKEYRRYIDSKRRVRYKQFTFVKVVDRNLPYQKRIY